MKTIIEEYVKKLIDNVPPSAEGKTQEIDLILDGGIFNGSYQIGSLFFLREMENQKKIKIGKISCCSAGALCALLYYIDRLDLAIDLYECTLEHFKKYKNLDCLHDYIDNKFAPFLKEDSYKKISNKICICFHDIKRKKKIVRRKYSSNDDLLQCIKRSTFIPYFINGAPVLEKRYIDGINPYIFRCEPNKKLLYIDLLGIDKITHAFSVKNEKTNFHRILAGILDIHLFFIKQTNTQMCSYVNDWSFLYWITNGAFKTALEKIIVYCVVLYICLIKYIPEQFKDTLAGKIFGEIFGLLIEHYCV